MLRTPATAFGPVAQFGASPDKAGNETGMLSSARQRSSNLLIFSAAGIFLVARAWRRPQSARSGSVLRSACGFALLAVGLHEAVDFSLQIPANLMALTLLIACLAMLAGAAPLPERKSEEVCRA